MHFTRVLQGLSEDRLSLGRSSLNPLPVSRYLRLSEAEDGLGAFPRSGNLGPLEYPNTSWAGIGQWFYSVATRSLAGIDEPIGRPPGRWMVTFHSQMPGMRSSAKRIRLLAFEDAIVVDADWAELQHRPTSWLA